ncbi:MAG: tRNA (adenosine(37)-N6)-dimethylallyltransferase MiaA [Lysobacterales bacterium]
MSEMAPPQAAPAALALLGPTAVGKSALAYALARQWPVTVISVDSAQVYRHLDIGSGKPDAAERAAVPHELIDLREPEQSYSAAEFAIDARAAIKRARAAGRLPLLVGGTHLYYRALDRGLSPLPPADPVLRGRLQGELAEVGHDALHARLRALDPQAAARIHRNDPQRLLRALEVIELTGRPLSEQQQQAGPGTGLPLLAVALLPSSRTVLHEQIERRLDAMLAAGFVDEVQGLMRRPGFDPLLPAYRSVGYRQLLEQLPGSGDLHEARARALYATRQLAKRQLTWLRSEPAVHTGEESQVMDLLQAWAQAWFAAPS